ncbi:MAG: hypothetical protein IJ737_02860 [Ruminococcus sp.]|nr:hypothetical protein [Ruminococcus sp.]
MEEFKRKAEGRLIVDNVLTFIAAVTAGAVVMLFMGRVEALAFTVPILLLWVIAAKHSEKSIWYRAYTRNERRKELGDIDLKEPFLPEIGLYAGDRGFYH